MPGRPAVLFVYGTLMRRRQMDAVLAGCCAWRYAGRATVAGELYDAGSYPALRLDRRSRARVPGMLVELDLAPVALARLDDYEGVGEGLYARRRRRVRARDGRVRIAWLYEYTGAVEWLPRIRRWRAGARSQAAR